MRVLFQGDSVTDANRDREDFYGLAGYSLYVQRILGEEYECLNRGVSGNRSGDVLARYEEDIEKLNPDIFCLLIGINDVWRRFDSNLYSSPAEYSANVNEIFKRLRSHNRKVKIVVLEPFLLPAPDRMHWRRDLISIVDELRKAAVEYADTYIPLDGYFAKLSVYEPWTEFSLDGVHPTDKGHRVIAQYAAEEIKGLK